MVIMIITGPICSGKETLANILKDKYGYKIHKIQSASYEDIYNSKQNTFETNIREKILEESNNAVREALLEWKESHVIYPFIYSDSIDTLLCKRSYIKVVSITAPLKQRYKYFCLKNPKSDISLDKFIDIDDEYLFNIGVEDCMSKKTIKFINKFDTSLSEEIDEHILIREKLFRPNWDQYFIKLAHIVKERSNCMKRSVGAIIVVNNRIVSTGYNGVPGKSKNCYEGGCKRCNDNLSQGSSLDECNCFHAEEAAVLEQGVHRSKGGTLYTTLSPCRWCTKVILASGIIRVVYDEKYSHFESEELLQLAGIKFDCVKIKQLN